MLSNVKLAGALCESLRLFCGAMPPFICAPFVRVHPAALTIRSHEVPRPVRVCSQGGWVRNGIKVDWINAK